MFHVLTGTFDVSRQVKKEKSSGTKLSYEFPVQVYPVIEPCDKLRC
jgi:hypothetical protein